MGIVEIQKKHKIDISKEEFKEYENCRISGLTNMFNLVNVAIITGLSRDKIRAIGENYEELLKQYPNIKN